MTIREFAIMLDDYTGSLTQTVDKLEIERARGTLSLDEEMDLIQDLRTVVKLRHIRPWRKRLLLSFFLGTLLITLRFMPLDPSWPEKVIPALGILGGLLLVWSIYCLWKLLGFRRLECQWLGRAEEQLAGGSSVFDLRD